MTILIIALSGIGDALMFSPALACLRAKFPDARIDLLAMFKGVEDLYRRNAMIDSVIYWDFLDRNIFSSLRCVLRLRGNHYDASIVVYPANRWPYNVISFMIGARRRFGHDYNHLNRSSLNFLNNKRIQEDDALHNVQENLRLAAMLGAEGNCPETGLAVLLNEEDRKDAGKWLRSAGLEGQSSFVGIHAGSAVFKNHGRRRWGAEKFATLAKMLVEQHGATVMLFGGPEEYELNDTIARMAGRGVVAVKAKSLMTSAALMEKCALFISNDSALMHVAAGLRLPTVAVFAYTNPRFVYPWGTKHVIVRHDMECSPCFYYSPRPASCQWNEDRFRCITHIEVAEVNQAVRQFLPENFHRG